MSAGVLIVGAGSALVARALLRRLLLAKFRRDVRRLNAGDHAPLLKAYADHAVLTFNEGSHRWSGSHRGKAAIDRFLRDFTQAGLQGEIRDLWIGGPPWALQLVARFDDQASGPDGAQIYANRAVLVVRTRWGKIVDHEDFYEDTRRIEQFDDKLRQLGVEPVGS